MAGFAMRDEQEDGGGLQATIASFTQLCRQHVAGVLSDAAFASARTKYEGILPCGRVAVAAIYDGVVAERSIDTPAPSPDRPS